MTDIGVPSFYTTEEVETGDRAHDKEWGRYNGRQPSTVRFTQRSFLQATHHIKQTVINLYHSLTNSHSNTLSQLSVISCIKPSHKKRDILVTRA